MPSRVPNLQNFASKLWEGDRVQAGPAERCESFIKARQWCRTLLDVHLPFNWDLWPQRPLLEGVLHAQGWRPLDCRQGEAAFVRFMCAARKQTTQATAFRLIKCLIKAYFGSEKNIPVDSLSTCRHSPRHEKGNWQLRAKGFHPRSINASLQQIPRKVFRALNGDSSPTQWLQPLISFESTYPDNQPRATRLWSADRQARGTTWRKAVIHALRR